MCKNLFKMPSMPSVPAPIAPPAPAETIAPEPEPLKKASERTREALDNTRKRAASLASLSSSTLTSPLGLTNTASTTSKSLLGQ